jgi:DNA-binding transcriptional regulator YhcF (GntR family)
MMDEMIDTIRENIYSGAWPPGFKLPSTRQLAQQFGISTASVAQAAKRLGPDGDGLIHGTTSGKQGRWVAKRSQWRRRPPRIKPNTANS